MACTKPMIRAEDYNGKVTIICTEEVAQIEELEKRWKDYETYTKYRYKRWDIIPCGKCIGCRLEKSRQWANRIILEMKSYPKDTNWFLTLTYDDTKVPSKTVKNEKTGEVKTGLTLNKKDLQDFMKRLRDHYKHHYNHQGIRYYACGEYGETTQRPHYHICLMNTAIHTELKKLKNTESGDALYTNEEIQKIWGMGNIAIGELNWETAAYTARYIMKKQLGKGSEEFYKIMAKEPEFTVMSRKPGIGKAYYEANKDKIYNYDEITVPKKGGAKKIKPPKYYDKIYLNENKTKMTKIKEKRKEIQKSAERQKDMQTTQSAAERREIQERTYTDKKRALPRTL